MMPCAAARTRPWPCMMRPWRPLTSGQPCTTYTIAEIPHAASSMPCMAAVMRSQHCASEHKSMSKPYLRSTSGGRIAIRSAVQIELCSSWRLSLMSSATYMLCREKVQLSVLMALVRQSVDKPLQRLPTLTAVFLAEASCALTQPGCPLFPAINRHLLRRPALDLEVRTSLLM